MSNNKKPKPETSKIVILAAFILVFAVSINACILMYLTNDTSPMTYLIPSAFTVLTASTGFYYWKARAENKIKLRNQAMLDTLKLRKQYSKQEIIEAEEMIQEIDELLNDESDDSSIFNEESIL